MASSGDRVEHVVPASAKVQHTLWSVTSQKPQNNNNNNNNNNNKLKSTVSTLWSVSTEKPHFFLFFSTSSSSVHSDMSPLRNLTWKCSIASDHHTVKNRQPSDHDYTPPLMQQSHQFWIWIWICTLQGPFLPPPPPLFFFFFFFWAERAQCKYTNFT